VQDFLEVNIVVVFECCKGRALTYRGYKWIYRDEYLEKVEQGEILDEAVYVKNSRTVVQLNMQGVFIKKFGYVKGKG
jgi:hypothetical protein